MSKHKCQGRIRLSRHAITEEVPQKPGVYAFWHKEKTRCVYVGKAKRLQERVMEHYRRDSHNEDLHVWIYYFSEKMEICFIEAEEVEIAKVEVENKKLETLFLKKFIPHENKDFPKEK